MTHVESEGLSRRADVESEGLSRRTIVEMLAEARTKIDRITVFELRDAVARGAIVVDIRPQAQRAIEGTLPGALAIERNVLEWRLDPSSDARLAIAVDHDVEWIFISSEGYTSSPRACSECSLRRSTASAKPRLSPRTDGDSPLTDLADKVCACD